MMVGIHDAVMWKKIVLIPIDNTQNITYIYLQYLKVVIM